MFNLIWSHSPNKQRNINHLKIFQAVFTPWSQCFRLLGWNLGSSCDCSPETPCCFHESHQYLCLFVLFRVNCSFYFKIGACRHGDRCSRLHNKPTFSQVRLLGSLAFILWERNSFSQNRFCSNSKHILSYVCFFRRLPSWTFTGTLRIVPSLLMGWLVSI